MCNDDRTGACDECGRWSPSLAIVSTETHVYRLCGTCEAEWYGMDDYGDEDEGYGFDDEDD